MDLDGTFVDIYDSPSGKFATCFADCCQIKKHPPKRMADASENKFSPVI
jgi:hypothetical protein